MNQFVAVLSFAQNADAFQAYSELKSAPVGTEVKAAAIVQRNSDGSISLPEVSAGTSVGFTTGSLIGMLVGILGGPLGVLLGWGAGALIGGLGDAETSADEMSALLALSKSIPVGRNALVLETVETNPEALDDFAKDRNATLVRRSLADVVNELEAADAAATAAQEAADKKLREQRKAERKESFDETIAKLKQKLHLGK